MEVNEEENDMKNAQKVKLCGSIRLLVAVLGCISLLVNYAQRMNVTVGILCMVNHTALSNNSNTTQNNYDGPFVWDRPVQGQILAAYYYGYIVFQAFGSLLAFHFGPFEVNFISVFLSSLFTLFLPLVAGNYVAFCTFRALIGLFGGLTWTSLLLLMANWTPISERSRLISLVITGVQIGSIITPPLSGALCSLSNAYRWSYIFYLTGAMGVLWCILWVACVRTDPAKHPFISEKEKKYLLSTVAIDKSTDDTKHFSGFSKVRLQLRSSLKQFCISVKVVPFRNIFNSISCRGLFLTHFFNTFAFYMVVTNISTFMHDISGPSLITNGFMSAVPFIGYLLLTLAASQLCDYVIKRNKLSRSNARKIFSSVGTFVPTVFVFIRAFNTQKSNTALSISLFFLIMTFMGFNTGGGYFLTPNDIAPKYSGIIWGISNTFATIPAIIMPTLIGYLTKNTSEGENGEGWKTVLIICGICNAFSGFLFVLFVRTEQEPWAISNDQKRARVDLTDDINNNADTFA